MSENSRKSKKRKEKIKVKVKRKLEPSRERERERAARLIGFRRFIQREHERHCLFLLTRWFFLLHCVRLLPFQWNPSFSLQVLSLSINTHTSVYKRSLCWKFSCYGSDFCMEFEPKEFCPSSKKKLGCFIDLLWLFVWSQIPTEFLFFVVVFLFYCLIASEWVLEYSWEQMHNSTCMC